jgi:2'-5' RNA ligase
MRSIRTFIAVELSGTVIARAKEAIRLLKTSGAEVGWVGTEQMHLTLKFLGNVPETETPDVCRIVAAAVAQVDPFEIVFRGLGAFPRASEPRTIWLGIDGGQEELAELHAAIEEGLKKEMGFAKEHRRFHPHLTLGRLRRESDPARGELTRLITENENFDGDLSIVEEVVTFASILSRQGPSHEPMGHASLAE